MSRTISHPRLAASGLLILATGVFLPGCGDDGRVVQVAREAADRQAEQNRQIAHQNHQIAETTHELVAADADSRRELVALQQDLQTQQAEVARQRDVLEGERREIARKRFWDSALGPAIESLTVGLICLGAIGVCCFLLYGLRQEKGAEPEISELLVEDLVAPHPVVLASADPTIVSDRPAIPALPAGPRTPADRSAST
jgi:hypothetical protein